MSLAAVPTVVIAFGLASSACTRQHHFATLKAGTSVTVETVDGADVEATVLPHTTDVVLADDGGRIIPIQHIARVVDVRRGRGALDGALIAGLSGAAIGAVLGFSAGDDNCESDHCLLSFSATDKAYLAGFMLGSLGAASGLIIGALIGSRDVYTFGDEREVRFIPSGPQGSVAGATIQF